MTQTITDSALMEMTADVVSAYVGHSKLAASEVPALIHAVFGALSGVTGGAAVAEAIYAEPQKPAVPIKKSITPEYLISLEDGRKYKSLKRHLRTAYNMSPDDYRAKWGLPKDYPMVAPAYAAARSTLAKQMGLGRGGLASAAEPPAEPVKPARKPRAAKVAEPVE